MYLNKCDVGFDAFERGNHHYNFFLGENINICWSPDGKCIAVGNKADLIAFIDMRNYR